MTVTDITALPVLAEAMNTAEIIDAAAQVLHDMDDLIGSSGGVFGLHLNGDPAPWGDLTEGGRFEGWLASLERLRVALAPEKENANGE